MNKHRLILCLAIIFVVSCNKKNPTSVPDELEWQSLGFEDKFALRLVLAKPYLYVCAGSDGLWRRNIRQASGEWEYVGLADTSLGRGKGVQDVSVHWQNPDWLLVSYQTGLGSAHGIYRSFGGGRNWAPADSGLEFYVSGQRYFRRLYRFLQYPDRILGAGHGVYKTQNFGDYWPGINAPPHIAGEPVILERHPIQSNIIWAGGNTATFSVTLGFSSDSGSTWEVIDLNSTVRPHTNSISSIAFDANDPNVVYVALASDLVKTTDGGKSWIVFDLKGAIKILSDPRYSGHLWVVIAPFQLMETWDGGATWQPIRSPIPEETAVQDMIWDEKAEVIYLGTLNGIYCFKP